MATLVIRDLQENCDLDKHALSRVTGRGYGSMDINDYYKTFFIPWTPKSYFGPTDINTYYNSLPKFTPSWPSVGLY